LSTRYDYCEILENKVETLKREKQEEVKQWRRMAEEKDRLISELMAQLGQSTAPLKIDTKVSPAASRWSPSSGYLPTFKNPFGRRGTAVS
jgi:hypothetical protein